MKVEIFEFVKGRDITEAADAYKEVFAGPPWNENTKCPDCGSFFGLETAKDGICPNGCKYPLEEAYPYKPTVEYILKESSRDNAQVLVARDRSIQYRDFDYLGRFAGFGWGFSYPSTDEFAQEKYKSLEMRDRMQAILDINGVIGPFFYISEVGVLPKYRGKGFSNRFVGYLLKTARKLSLPTVMRTNQDSPMIAVANRFDMDQVLGPKIDLCKGCKRWDVLDRAVNNTWDSENRSRVLYLTQPG